MNNEVPEKIFGWIQEKKKIKFQDLTKFQQISCKC